jgi:hypothetical protein
MFTRKKLLSVIAATSVLVASLATIALTQNTASASPRGCEGSQVRDTLDIRNSDGRLLGTTRVYWNGVHNCAMTTLAPGLNKNSVTYIEATVIGKNGTVTGSSVNYNPAVISGHLVAPGCINVIGAIGYGPEGKRSYVQKYSWCD